MDRTDFGLDLHDHGAGPADPAMSEPDATAVITNVELTPKEFDGLLERLGPEHQASAQHPRLSGRYEILLMPICFCVDQQDYQRHQLQVLVAKFSSGWKNVLSEATLVKLRAALAAIPAKPRRATG